MDIDYQCYVAGLLFKPRDLTEELEKIIDNEKDEAIHSYPLGAKQTKDGGAGKRYN